MEKDTKILLMATVVILVALVSFNLSDLTGKVISETTTLAISPEIITFGLHDTAKITTIRVSPSNMGVDKKIDMYRCKDKKCNQVIRVSGETAKICTDNICSDDVTISYRLSANLKQGTYYWKAEKKVEGEIQIYKSNTFDIL